MHTKIEHINSPSVLLSKFQKIQSSLICISDQAIEKTNKIFVFINYKSNRNSNAKLWINSSLEIVNRTYTSIWSAKVKIFLDFYGKAYERERERERQVWTLEGANERENGSGSIRWVNLIICDSHTRIYVIL